jgi:hypothetical protein
MHPEFSILATSADLSRSCNNRSLCFYLSIQKTTKVYNSMKIICLLAITTILGLAGQASAAVTINFSTSNTDAGAGAELNLGLGETGSMFVWVSSDPGQTLTGIALNIVSDNLNVLQATSYEIENPSGDRWADVNNGTLGDLVSGSQAFALPPFAGDGLATGGDFVLHSTVQFVATELGSTNLSFTLGSNGVGDLNGNVTPEFNTGFVNVTAVPEPGSFALLGLIGVAYGYKRRRGMRSAAALA